MTFTWFFYLLGALYIIAPVIAWILFLTGVRRLILNYYFGAHIPASIIPWSVIVWFVGMFVMLIALIVGHLDFGIGLGAIIKSSIGWAKGWALLALFPFIGCMSIRPQLVYRASCVIGLHTLLLIPVFVFAWAAGLPQVAYVSPLKAVGGPGPEFFMVSLYEIDPGSGTPRWRLFTPWAPAVGFVANLYFVFALVERTRFWKVCGICGCIAMILMSQSRLAIVSLITVPLVALFLSNLMRPVVIYLCGLGCTIAGMIAVPFISFADTAVTSFKEARADSSRVRSALGRIAVNRWRSEAPVWGHGVVERGPHMVEYMPIGSHHSWYGLLFVKGIVGLFALLVPMVMSFAHLLVRSQKIEEARVGLSILLILFLYTFGENLEILAYLIWPGLLFLGIGVAGERRISAWKNESQ